MKHQLKQQLSQAVAKLRDELALDLGPVPEVQLTRSRDPRHGDFACNIALMLAKPARRNPREVAQLILNALPKSSEIAKTEVAGPGFINFFLRADAIHAVVKDILNQGKSFGLSDLGAGKKVQVEFVSANPTGPLHVGHGRGAAYGATVANLLEAVGFEVQREYYVNDAGRQMDILATSVWLRYLELCGETIPFPANGYKGDYVWDIAASLHRDHGDTYRRNAAEVFADLPPDAPQDQDAQADPHPGGPNQGDKEAHIDGLIARAKTLLDDNRYRFVFELALNTILDDIRDDLDKFGVVYDHWFSERSLADKGAINRAIERLRKSDHLYEQDGALWFRSTDYGDEKDRVVERENGQTTYFASDIAYHMDKLERNFDRVIDVWGADHHGYIPRVKGALAALGDDPDKLDVLLVQFANLYRGGQKVQMSTRSGEFVSLRQLRKEVGTDAARFFYVMRRCEQHLDFDLDLAKSQSADNPVYYIQYGHARICSVLKQAQETGLAYHQQRGLDNLERLTETHETALLTSLSRYGEVLESAAMNEEPHQLTHYLRELANDFHTYYNAHQFLVEQPALRDARLCLIVATRHILSNGLSMLGVSAPEEM